MSSDSIPTMEIMPSMQLLAEAAQEQEKLPEPVLELEDEDDDDDDDDRSSSLSELEDRAGTEGSDPLEDESSEGEDEHLDDDHEGEHEEDVGEIGGELAEDHNPMNDAGEIMDEEDEANDTEAETERLQDSPEKRRPSRTLHLRAADALQVPDDNLDQTSEISALSDSEPEGISQIPSLISSPRKRKRDEQETDDEVTTERSLKKVSRKLEEHVDSDEDDDDELDHRDHADKDKDDAEDVSDEEHTSSKENTPERDMGTHDVPKDDEEASVVDEAEAEGADGEVETNLKGEEDAAKKEAALQELRAIEKDFALLRDKLFVEKSQRLNEELELLKNSPTSHTEFAIAAGAIARRRDEQKQLAVTMFEYNVRNLQKTCIAERSMAHCQYMQVVRESREKALDQAGHEWYRIRERRRAENDESEKRYHFNRDRAVQVASQQAYNREVSILSGLQKYVGFPAAPQLEIVSEVDKLDDLKKMGISTKPPHNVPISAPISSFPRQQPRTDESFLERNLWANPAQVYGAQMMGASPQLASGPGNNFATPAATRRQTEPQTQHSASTIAVSSVEQTPMSNQAAAVSDNRMQLPQSEGPAETPSRNSGSVRPELAITDASPPNGNPSSRLNSIHTTNGINGLTVARATEGSISPRSSPLKTAQVQAVSAGSS